MKIYENSEITGSLKIRGRVRENVTTQGGFYSEQFGEIAYQSDIPTVGSADAPFYGIVVKNVNSTLTPNASFPKINTITFRAPDFYITQNTPNSDEVTVDIRESRVLVLDKRGQTFFPKGTTNERTLYSMTLPANTLPPGRVLNVRFLMNKIQGGNRTHEWEVTIDGLAVFRIDDAGGGTGNINVNHPLSLEFWFGVASNLTNKMHVWTEFIQPGLDAVAVKVGQGEINAFNMSWGAAGHAFFDFDPTVVHTFTFTDVPSSNDVAISVENTLVRLL